MRSRRHFWAADNIKTGVAKLTGQGQRLQVIAAEAIDAAEHHDERLTQQVPLHEWIDNVLARAVGRIGNALQHAAAVPRDDRLDRAVRRPVRHGVGHLSRADRHRHRRPGVDRQGRGPGRRGADHDGDRPCGRGAGGARLQLAAPPQQDDHRERVKLFANDLQAGDRQRLACRRHRREGHRAARRRSKAPRREVARRRSRWHESSVSASADEEERAISEINTTPLVDVMLVLLIIFLITIPVVTQSVKVELPKEANHPDADQAREHHHRGRQGRQRLLEHGAGADPGGAARAAEGGRGAGAAARSARPRRPDDHATSTSAG